jgi:hypothetical protein
VFSGWEVIVSLNSSCASVSSSSVRYPSQSSADEDSSKEYLVYDPSIRNILYACKLKRGYDLCSFHSGKFEVAKAKNDSFTCTVLVFAIFSRNPRKCFGIIVQPANRTIDNLTGQD